MINIVVPMAGHGSRFSRAGYALPKPLIDVKGKPMIERVVRNITPATPHRFVFLCLSEHLVKFPMAETLRALSPGCEVVEVNQVTEGAACTVLLAREFINNGDGLMIANSDQWVDVDIDLYLGTLNPSIDGIIMTMRASDPKWSFVGLDSNGLVTRVAEKVVISNEATVGIYNFRAGSDFVTGAEAMIAKGVRVNGEYYVAPVYNELIAASKRIGIYNVGTERNGMYGLGIPEDLDWFLSHPIAGRLQ